MSACKWVHQWAQASEMELETSSVAPEDNNSPHCVVAGNGRDLHVVVAGNSRDLQIVEDVVAEGDDIAVVDNNTDAEEDSNIVRVDDNIPQRRDCS